MAIRLRVRKTPTDQWLENFSRGGWRVRDPSNGTWILMTPENTKVRSADNTQWQPVK